LAFANESRNAVPHSLVTFFEPEYVHVPSHRAFNVAHGKRDVINSLVLEHRIESSHARLPLQRERLWLAYLPMRHFGFWLLALFLIADLRPSQSADLPRFRPALPGSGPTALVNQIDTG